MTDSTLQFYDSLAKDYDLIFSDWRQAVLRQGEVLDRLIQAELGVPPLSALDCSCGIGTQAIGLAVKGYQVHGTDINSNAVERASREAESFGVSPTWGVADFRTLAQQVSGSFDVVVSCDNSLPHLTSDDDLLLAARNMRLKLRDGGLLMVSIRDYDQIVGGRPDITSPRVLGEPRRRRLVIQLWDWAPDGRTYVLEHLIVRETGEEWMITHRVAKYRALLREELSDILDKVGFSDIRWLMPEESGYYQPIVTARSRL